MSIGGARSTIDGVTISNIDRVVLVIGFFSDEHFILLAIDFGTLKEDLLGVIMAY